MKHGKYEARRWSPRVFTALIALTLTLCCATGGTIAWLTSTPDAVSGTFVIGNINITLSDAKGVLKAGNSNAVSVTEGVTYTPGQTIEADPKVSVDAGSEACFLFIHIREENNSFGTDKQKVIQWELWELDEGSTSANWAEVPGRPGYYYRKVDKLGDHNANYEIFKASSLIVNKSLTKEIVDATGFQSPTITITAAAVQKENIPDSNNDKVIDWKDALALLPADFTMSTSSGN